MAAGRRPSAAIQTRKTATTLPPGRRGGPRRDRPAADDPPRLRPAPHGLPRADLDRLGHVLPLLQGRWDIARPSRVQANALLQRPWIEPEPRGDGGTPGDDRP